MNWQKNYEIIEKALVPLLEIHNLNLFSIKYFQEDKENILQVIIEDENFQLDLERCGIINKFLSEKLDDWNFISDNYFLEVTSPGIERPLKNKEEIKKCINKYIYFEFNCPVNKYNFVEGYLKSFTDEDELKVLWNNKGQIKKMIINYDNIKNARRAVEFTKGEWNND